LQHDVILVAQCLEMWSRNWRLCVLYSLSVSFVFHFWILTLTCSSILCGKQMPHPVPVIITACCPATGWQSFCNPCHNYLCNILCLSAWQLFLNCLTLTMKALWLFEISGFTSQMTQHQIWKHLNFQKLCWRDIGWYMWHSW
jgi:hypothetical protein